MSEGKKEILLGDCLELMKDIPNGSIDMILCDLPYGTTACKWDTIIPFDKLWEQYKRIVKPNGAIILFGSQPFTTDLIMSNRDWFKYELIWDKDRPTGFPEANKKPLKVHENICVFYAKQPTYNPIKWKGRPNNAQTRGNKAIDKTVERGKMPVFNNSSVDLSGDKFPISIVYEKKIAPTKYLHPTQKPLELIEYLIKTYTNEGELILDNCAGSGTTAIACLNTKRQFIVMEKEQKYYDIILKRVGDFNKKFETQTLFGNEM
jgi:site-specific DNA-methyltransferase (adenine-specific)